MGGNVSSGLVVFQESETPGEDNSTSSVSIACSSPDASDSPSLSPRPEKIKILSQIKNKLGWLINFDEF